MPINTVLPYYHTTALGNALKAAVPSAIDAISAYGPTRPISMLWLGNDAVLTAPQEATAQAIFDAHDPVFLSADKLSVLSDGSDIITITVSAPKTGAAAVTLICTKPDGTALTQAVPLTSGVGTTTFKTKIEGVYLITLQNPSNRTTDQLTLTAV